MTIKRLGSAARLPAWPFAGRASRRVAWVGPRDASLVAAFVQGVHAVEPGTTILRQWSVDRPAACKESALTAVGRGATVIMAPHGLCAAAAIDGAHERNQPGLELSDFQLPERGRGTGRPRRGPRPLPRRRGHRLRCRERRDRALGTSIRCSRRPSPSRRVRSPSSWRAVDRSPGRIAPTHGGRTSSRAARDHEAVPGRARQRRRQLRSPPR